MFTKQKVAMLVAEFLGASVLTLAFLAVLASNVGIAYFTAFGAGVALLVAVLLFNNVSGGLFNPAMTIGLWTVRKIATLQMILFVAVQLLGGLAAYYLFSYLSTVDLGTATSSLTEYKSTVLVAEVVGAAVLAMGYAVATYQRLDTTLKAVVVGGAFAIGIIIASTASAMAFLNPAIAMGAQAWTWGTFVLGPVLGAIIGFNLYGLLFAANGGVVGAGTSTAAPAAAVKVKRVTTKKKVTKVRKK